jgi:UDP-N-acetyl-D-glucosamine dehydrogenase
VFRRVGYISRCHGTSRDIGLGYMGLPLGVSFSEVGLEVVGVGTNPKKVAAVNRGVSYIEDLSSERLELMTRNGRFEATEEPGALGEADAILICLPTPLDKHREPDVSAVLAGA